MLRHRGRHTDRNQVLVPQIKDAENNDKRQQIRFRPFPLRLRDDGPAGIDQVLPCHPLPPIQRCTEPNIGDARSYRGNGAEECQTGAIPRPVEVSNYYLGGGAWRWRKLDRAGVDFLRIINLEDEQIPLFQRGTYWRDKEIHYSMDPPTIDA